MLTTEQLIIVVIFLLAYWIYSQQPQLKTTQQTQTELTAEQITQMEKALTEQTTKITALTSTQTELTKQLTHKEVEINQLKEKTKDLEPNATEKELLGIASGVDWNQYNWKNFLGPLETGADWNQLRAPYSQIRNNLLTYAKTALKQAELEAEIEKEAKTRQELQTKYDLEVRSKEELLNYLKFYREQPFIPIGLSDEYLPLLRDKEFMKRYFEQHGLVGRWKSLLLFTSSSGYFNYFEDFDSSKYGNKPLEIDLQGATYVSSLVFTHNLLEKLKATATTADREFKTIKINLYSHDLAKKSPVVLSGMDPSSATNFSPIYSSRVRKEFFYDKSGIHQYARIFIT